MQELIKENFKLNILEVGCVLKHYSFSSKIKLIVVNKYEKFENVINEDIVEYKPKIKYDLIVSVSTIEHIGIEDGIIIPEKAKYAINQIIKNCLSKKGSFYFTIPIGYNKYLDKQIFNNEISFSEKHYFIKFDKNTWLEASKDQVLDSKYNKPFIGANALFLGVIKK